MIIERPAGAYIQKADGSLEPDPNDEATAARLGLMEQGDRVAVGHAIMDGSLQKGAKKKEVKADADTRK